MTVPTKTSAALLLAFALCLFAAPAQAQSTCEGGARETQATCGADLCECASPCTSNGQCSSGCCNSGYCSPPCVCAGEGTVRINCSFAGGCGATVTASTPASTATGWWGFGLIGLGLLASVRAGRKGGLRSTATIAALSLCLLGAAFLTASALESRPAARAKSLLQ